MDEDPHLFNHQFAAEIYDRMIERNYPSFSKPRNQFILDLIKKHQCHKILNLGCGTGNLAIFLGKEGYEVIGLDLSDHMLDIAKSKISNISNDIADRVKFVQGDIINFSLSQKFSLITISGGVFCHLLSQKDQIQCLNLTYKHLDVGGILCMDTIWPKMKKMVDNSDPNQKKRYFNKCFHFGPNNHRLDGYEDLFIDLANQHLLGRQIYYEYNADGKILNEYNLPMNIRLTFPSEMRLLFKLCGFKILNENNGYSSDPIEYGKRIVWSVQKHDKA